MFDFFKNIVNNFDNNKTKFNFFKNKILKSIAKLKN